MNPSTILFLVISVLVAGGISYFQYYYKAKSLLKVTKLLAFLRFLIVFGILLLLINPMIRSHTYEVQKTPLAVLVDNSSSIFHLNAKKTQQDICQKLLSNSELKRKFDVQAFAFDADCKPLNKTEDITLKGTQTNLEAAAKNVKSIYKNTKYVTALLSDGNQTTGADYVFGFDQENKVYPIVLGDTTTYLDLKISRINVNKYAFHKNKFPVEVFLQYAGTKNVQAQFSIAIGNEKLYTEKVLFTPEKKSVVLNALLPANGTGVQVYTASIVSLEKEKNTYNNSKKFAVEIIEQKTEVALIAAINHPDLGALKRSIESNAQRKVTILKPNSISDLQKYNVLIFYQPNASFKSVMDSNAKLKINSWIITGNDTDFNFLNQQQQAVDFKMASQKEDYLAVYNTDFNLFALDDFGFEGFPPLENLFGNITVKNNLIPLLSSRIRNVDTGAPLFAFEENLGKRNAFLFGENLWKWRAKSYVDTKSYEKFDTFLSKVIQFLASNDARKSLIVNHERFYNYGDALEITAQYFNKNYEFDDKAKLTISLTNKKTKQVKNYDLLKSTNCFKVNLDGLTPGSYSFVVKELQSNTSYSGNFEIIDFDIEKQFVNPDLTKLKQLAVQTKGAIVLPNQVDAFIKQLIDNTEYKTIEKEVVKNTPLLDWYWILIGLVVLLGLEWFVRKYNGLL
ncbi:hypothetical protein [Flavobacterium aciduliphilum]|uniref:VWA domain-containing protein n=1 Tax=Flavobacterium aciduliphilum TaxID=1101402 RepID=A0A328YK55_9FLAO|nr:hypothetical protein [Flavobacterium aciduliphilum]RAR73900.1 hypothetical protein CLV55_103223 [Flavobacterium aciduliphilum]